MKYENSTGTSVSLTTNIANTLGVSIDDFDNLRAFLQDASGKRRYSKDIRHPDVFMFFDLDIRYPLADSLAFFDHKEQRTKADYLIEFNSGVIENIQVITDRNDNDADNEIEIWLRDKAKLRDDELEFLASYRIRADIKEVDADKKNVSIWVAYNYGENAYLVPLDSYLADDEGDTYVFADVEEALDHIDYLQSQTYALDSYELARPDYYVVAKD